MRELIEATGFSRGGGDTDAGYSSSKRTFLIKDKISSFSFLGFGQGCGMLWDDGGDAEKSEEWKGKKSSRNKKDGGQGGGSWRCALLWCYCVIHQYSLITDCSGVSLEESRGK